jgi:threonine dehydratase
MTALIDRIRDAHRAVRPHVLVTPLDRSSGLSSMIGCDVWLKADHLQPTGSFKLRGATNKLRLLAEDPRNRAVITASTGNHGRAVAYAGQLFGLGVTVYVSAMAPPQKMAAIRAAGATLVTVDGGALDAELAARHQAGLQGIPYVAPYNDFDTIAGQGTLGMELAEQVPELDAVFVCVGGGGLIAGIGTALRHLSPSTRVIGVWPEASTCMLDSLNAGKIVATPESDTLSEASTGAVEPGSVTFPVCQQVIDETLTVSEAEIAHAMQRIASEEGWMVEGTAGVALAGLMKRTSDVRNRKVAAVLCGRNIALETFKTAMAMPVPA